MFSISETQHSLTVNWDGQEVLGYHFPEDGNRPYCHPLRLPGGPPLTMNEPGDHVHHQGMWVAWKKVNGLISGSSLLPVRMPLASGNRSSADC